MLKKGKFFHFCSKDLRLNFLLTPSCMILHGVSFFILKFEYLSENETKIENILTHWSVAQAGSNDENNWGSKISLDCPFSLL